MSFSDHIMVHGRNVRPRRIAQQVAHEYGFSPSLKSQPRVNSDMMMCDTGTRRGALALMTGFALLAPILIAPPAAAQPSYIAGKWELVNYGPNKARPDHISLWLMAETLIPIPNPADPRPGSRAALTLGCERGVAKLFVNLNYQFVVPGRRLTVSYRIDGGLLADAVWNTDEGLDIGIFPTHPVAFVRSLQGKRSLELSLTLAGKPGTAHFDIRGLDAALAHLTPHCGW